jgi:hypothetical protein
MRALVLALLLAVAPAHADDMVYQDGGVTVRLMNAPCPKSAMVKVLEGASDVPARIAIVSVKGRGDIGACWTIMRAEAAIVLLDEEGDAGVIPMADFRRSPGI